MKAIRWVPFLALLTGILALGGVPLAQAATTITSEQVYVKGISQVFGVFDGSSSLAMDAAGNPHVAFVDDINQNIMYGTKSGGVWTFDVIAPDGIDPIFGDQDELTSIAVDPSGNPHIAYWDPEPNLLRYASKSGGVWTIETADPETNQGRGAVLAIDAAGDPHITYYDQTNLYMKYATKHGGVWTNEVLETGSIFEPERQNLALDASGNPHVMYLDYNLGAIKVAVRSGGVWTSEYVPGLAWGSGLGAASSFAVDAAGNPHIAVIPPVSPFNLLHVWKSGGMWSSESVDPGRRRTPSIRVNSAGIPCMSYADNTIGAFNLKYATRTGGVWTNVVVDAPGSVGLSSWLAFDASGNPHMTYADLTNTAIRYASIESSGGNVSGTLLANCPAAGTPPNGVTVDAFTVGGGMLAGTTATDATGSYLFEGLAAGNYSMVMVTPLGYSAALEEQAATVVNGQTTTADFDLTCSTPSGDVQAGGFWKHEVGVATTGTGHAEVDASTLCGYLDLIAAHFNSNQVNPVVVYVPPASDDCTDKLASAATLLNLQGSAAMRDKARQSLLALLLNVASGRLGTMVVISKDGATASQAITYCDNQIDSPTGDYAQAKSIADDINNGKKVGNGMIPLSTQQIAYREGLAMRTFTVTPNPGPGARRFSFTMGQAGSARLNVYDVSGRLVARLSDGPIAAGPHSVSWDGRTRGGQAVGTGIYFARLETTDGAKTLKVVQQSR